MYPHKEELNLLLCISNAYGKHHFSPKLTFHKKYILQTH